MHDQITAGIAECEVKLSGFDDSIDGFFLRVALLKYAMEKRKKKEQWLVILAYQTVGF